MSREVRLHAVVPARPAREVFGLLRRMERYPQISSSILRVDVDAQATPPCSTWHVQFREGVLVWTERDLFDEAALELRFEQVDGDFEQLAGRWQVLERPQGCEIVLETTFDFGIPSLRHLIDPLAERALYDNGVELLLGLVGDDAQVLSARPSGGALEELLDG
ncbi:MAG TPA: SRPBCC family protein [Conexibacter sp.]|nr:SRPBCC family protein [Conexibacter sp.]